MHVIVDFEASACVATAGIISPLTSSYETQIVLLKFIAETLYTVENVFPSAADNRLTAASVSVYSTEKRPYEEHFAASTQYGFVERFTACNVEISDDVELTISDATSNAGSVYNGLGEALKKLSSEKFTLKTFPVFSDSVIN